MWRKIFQTFHKTSSQKRFYTPSSKIFSFVKDVFSVRKILNFAALSFSLFLPYHYIKHQIEFNQYREYIYKHKELLDQAIATGIESIQNPCHKEQLSEIFNLDLSHIQKYLDVITFEESISSVVQGELVVQSKSFIGPLIYKYNEYVQDDQSSKISIESKTPLRFNYGEIDIIAPIGINKPMNINDARNIFESRKDVVALKVRMTIYKMDKNMQGYISKISICDAKKYFTNLQNDSKFNLINVNDEQVIEEAIAPGDIKIVNKGIYPRFTKTQQFGYKIKSDQDFISYEIFKK